MYWEGFLENGQKKFLNRIDESHALLLKLALSDVDRLAVDMLRRREVRGLKQRNESGGRHAAGSKTRSRDSLGGFDRGGSDDWLKFIRP